MKNKVPAQQAPQENKEEFDGLLRRMLSTQPQPHPKPAKKVAKKKTAK